MILDHDCVREILLAVEQCPFNQSLTVDKLADRLPAFSRETIWYACLKMDEGGLLDVETVPPHMSFLPGINRIICMTYKGHEFLDTIREPERWAKVKTIGHGIRDYSLAAIGKIAEGITSALIDKAILNAPDL